MVERSIKLEFRVTPEEKAIIDEKMAQIGTQNLSAYLRKMALDGYAINVDIPEIKELTALLRRYGANLNQLARRVNETSRFYDADMEDLRQGYEKLWDGLGEVLRTLAKL